MYKTYKFRLNPNKKQEIKLNNSLLACMNLYNNAIAERKQQAKINKLYKDLDLFPWGKPIWITYYDQSKKLSVFKDKKQKEVYCQVLHEVLRRVEKRFKMFFKNKIYPRFKNKNRYNTFTYPQNGFEIQNKKLNLSKIGDIKIVLHSKIKGTIKSCTIKKDLTHWYAIFIVKIEEQIKQIPIKTSVGVDVGLKSLLTLSDGKKVTAPKFLRKSEEKLIREQRKLSRKKRDSKNRDKQRIKVAKVYKKIKNQRKDFNHKISRELVNNYDLIVFENLNIKRMLRNHYFAKSILDAGWYQLQTFTAYKAEWAGKQCKFVAANGTSQECCGCGNIEYLTLSDRVFKCSKCGNIKDRDINAAINIESRVHAGSVESTPVESSRLTLNEPGILT